MSSFLSPTSWPEDSNSPESVQSSNAHSEGTAPGSSTRLSLGFFKMGRKEGEQKKRGPKPDQKPPANERQARNRQAQRTHRERKERYVKMLEEEVLRLREAFTTVTKEKSMLVEENRRLKELLLAHGIDGSNYPISSQTHTSQQREGGPTALNLPEIAQQFILALEIACIDHIQIVANNAAQNADFISGHALMTTCPPESHSISKPNENWSHKTANLPPEDLAILYNLETLETQRQKYFEIFDGELSPVAAWTMISGHPRFKELTLQDFGILTGVLAKKATCQGFGAVIEEFEVQDALDSIFAAKSPYS